MYSLPVSYTLSSVPVLQDWSLPLFNGLLPVSVVGESVERELRCGVSLAAKVSRVSPKHTHERSVKTQIDFLKIHTLTWPTKMAYKTNSIYTHSCHKYFNLSFSLSNRTHPLSTHASFHFTSAEGTMTG